MIIVGVLAALCCAGLLLVSSLIPQDIVETNARESAKYFKEHMLFDNQIGTQDDTKRDNYADSITSCIAWHLGNKEAIEAAPNRSNPFIRILEARYTQEDGENVNIGFDRAMNENASANQTYSRYWHGGAALVRLLYPTFSVTEMHSLFLLLGMALTVFWIVYLVVRKEYPLAIAYGIGAIAVKLVFAYTCFEYTFVLMLTPIISFLVYLTYDTEPGLLPKPENERKKKLSPESIFLLAGILTCFFDFLTAETLTFTLPAFVMLAQLQKATNKPYTIRREGETVVVPWKKLFNAALAWFAGYAGMFALKWILVLIVLGKEEFMTAMTVAAERSIGEVHQTLNMASPTVGVFTRIKLILLRNFACLFSLPNSLSEIQVALILAGIICVIGLLWFFLRKKPDKEKGKKTNVFFPLYLAVALLPVIRFFVLSNHAYQHYFFTYRALMATVAVLVYVFIQTTVLSQLLNPPRQNPRRTRRGAR